MTLDDFRPKRGGLRHLKGEVLAQCFHQLICAIEHLIFGAIRREPAKYAAAQNMFAVAVLVGTVVVATLDKVDAEVFVPMSLGTKR